MKKNSGRTSSFTSTSQGDQGFWPSYADMMSAVALILFFLMLLAYIQNLITGNELQKTKEVLEDTQVLLVTTQEEVDAAQQELGAITMSLDSAKEELRAQQATIDSQLQDIEKQQGVIDAQKATLDQQQDTLQTQQATIDAQKLLAAEQEQYLISTQKEITQLRGQMQTIAVLRLSILEQIRDSIAGVMGDASKVSIGDNGSIVLSESILFDFGSAEVKKDSTQVLNQLATVFAQFLADNENAKYVDSIVISGHTDNVGSAEQNRKLSTDRANSVLTYLLEANGGRLTDYAQFFCAAGYGVTRPVADNSTQAGRAANRRIEVSMILKDETVLEIVEQYLSIEPPKG